MSTDDDASSPQQPQVARATSAPITGSQDADAEGSQPETVDKLPNVQNDISDTRVRFDTPQGPSVTNSLNLDSERGSTNPRRPRRPISNSIPNGVIENILSANQEGGGSGLESSTTNSVASHRGGRRSIARGVSRSNSVHIVYVPAAPPSESGSEYQPFSFWNSSRSQKVLLASLASVEFTANMCLSILAPFFPNEVRDPGAEQCWVQGRNHAGSRGRTGQGIQGRNHAGSRARTMPGPGAGLGRGSRGRTMLDPGLGRGSRG